MDDYEDHPELAGYEPHEERPLRGRHFTTIMRVAVFLGLAGLVLPGILITLATANSTALRACAAYTGFYAPGSVSFSTRFEFAGPEGAGWNCYAVSFDGQETLVRALGLIPGAARIPTGPVENS